MMNSTESPRPARQTTIEREIEAGLRAEVTRKHRRRDAVDGTEKRAPAGLPASASAYHCEFFVALTPRWVGARPGMGVRPQPVPDAVDAGVDVLGIVAGGIVR